MNNPDFKRSKSLSHLWKSGDGDQETVDLRGSQNGFILPSLSLVGAPSPGATPGFVKENDWHSATEESSSTSGAPVKQPSASKCLPHTTSDSSTLSVSSHSRAAFRKYVLSQGSQGSQSSQGSQAIIPQYDIQNSHKHTRTPNIDTSIIGPSICATY